MLFQVLLGGVPGSNRVAEEQKIVHDTLWVQEDDVADATEGAVLLLVVSNVPQRKAPTNNDEKKAPVRTVEMLLL